MFNSPKIRCPFSWSKACIGNIQKPIRSSPALPHHRVSLHVGENTRIHLDLEDRKIALSSMALLWSRLSSTQTATVIRSNVWTVKPFGGASESSNCLTAASRNSSEEMSVAKRDPIYFTTDKTCLRDSGSDSSRPRKKYRGRRKGCALWNQLDLSQRR